MYMMLEILIRTSKSGRVETKNVNTEPPLKGDNLHGILTWSFKEKTNKSLDKYSAINSVILLFMSPLIMYTNKV